MLREEVWRAALPKPVASEPRFRRPIAPVQSDAFTRSRIRTVLAVVATSNQRLARAPGNVVLPTRVSGLPQDSVANVSQIVTLDKTFLVERCARLSGSFLRGDVWSERSGRRAAVASSEAERPPELPPTTVCENGSSVCDSRTVRFALSRRSGRSPDRCKAEPG